MTDRTIRMNTTAAGPEGTFLAGQVVSVDAATAAAWIAGGYASPVGEDAGARSPRPAAAARSSKSKKAPPTDEPASSESTTAEEPSGEQPDGGDPGETSGEE